MNGLHTRLWRWTGRRVMLCLVLGWVAQALQAAEVPFVTTPHGVTRTMLELAEVGPKDRLIDLGSGDGRIVIAAARYFGARAVGVEMVPDLVASSREAARAAGVEDRTEFRMQDLFATDLKGFTVVTMYLLPEVNLQLRERLLALPPGTRIVSHDWDLGDWRPEQTVDVQVPEKTLGLGKLSRVHRWTVPARIEGRWCSTDGDLVVQQRFDAFSATMSPRAGSPVVFDGRIRGLRLETVGMVMPHVVLQGATPGEALPDRAVLAVNGLRFSRCR